MRVSEKAIEGLIDALNRYALGVDMYEYGLPEPEYHPRLVQIVSEWLAKEGLQEKAND